MARKPSPEKRTERVPTMYAPSELVILKSNAKNARMNKADFTRYKTTGVEPKKLLPTVKEEFLIKGVGALQQIDKKLEQIKGMVSDDIMMMVRTELMAARQLIAKGFDQ